MKTCWTSGSTTPPRTSRMYGCDTKCAKTFHVPEGRREAQVRIGATARTLALAAAWRAGSKAAGQNLVRTLATDDETVRMLAGMSLVQSGPRAAPVVRECVKAREGLPDSL